MTSPPQNLHTDAYLIFKVLQTLVNPQQQPTDNQSTTSLQIVYNLSLPMLPPLCSGIVSAGRLGFSAKPTRQSPFPICLKYANPAYVSLTIWDTLWLCWREHKWDAGRCSNFINAIQYIHTVTCASTVHRHSCTWEVYASGRMATVFSFQLVLSIVLRLVW